MIHRSSPERRPLILLSGFIMGLFAILLGQDAFRNLSNGTLDTDSYYQMVRMLNFANGGDLHYIDRDNSPYGSYVHWSIVYPQTIWLLHYPLRALGFTTEEALRYTGGLSTPISLCLLAILLSWAIARDSTNRALLIAALVLATSLPIHGYGRADRIGHHIFYLLPLAGAAGCLLRGASGRMETDALGGALLTLALWITPETLPFVLGLIAMRTAARIEDGGPRLLAVGFGLLSMAGIAHILDPPPPTFDTWAVDHFSMAHILLLSLCCIPMLVADATVGIGAPRWRITLLVGITALVCLLFWFIIVPESLGGATGLIGPELKKLWWDNVLELQPPQGISGVIAFLFAPLLGGGAALLASIRSRSLTMFCVSLIALGYIPLALQHQRMGEAACLAGAFATAMGLGQAPAFSRDNSLLAQFITLIFGALPLLHLIAVIGAADWPEMTNTVQATQECSIKTVEKTLDSIPESTFLTPLDFTAEMLYRTQHRTIAGPYHHNVQGMLDSYHAWMDTSPDSSRAKNIIQKRGISYILGCKFYPKNLHGVQDASFADKIAKGSVPNWLVPIPWPKNTKTALQLYRVNLP